jgi:purine nucleoside phosphorylase
MASGILDKPLSHEEVTATANSVRDKFVKVVRACIGKVNWD